MKKKTKVILISLAGVFAMVIPLYLVAQFGKDETNYQEDYINSVKPIEVRKLQYNFESENYQIFLPSDDEHFRILQLSDTHFVGGRMRNSLDLKTLKSIYKMVDYAKPDLVIYTGDILYPTLYLGSNDNLKSAKILNSFFEKMEVPFLYEYGNHDTEYYGTATADDINEIFQTNKYCIAREDDEILFKSGRLSQMLELRNSDGTLNNALILLDSGSYLNGSSFFSGYANFTLSQSYWYEKKIQKLMERENYSNTSDIKSLAFFHIPPYEYKKATELYKKGSSEVQKIFGENHEKVSSPNTSSRLMEKVIEYGSTQAMFFGHNHKNSLALKYKGIEFYYGHSIDYRAYPTLKFDTRYRGGLIIDINSDSTYKIEPKLLIDIENEVK
ncbi:MAG: metallophosphoesterase [Erysipelotrichaceae bacterium]|nr:metallophosphoesterase [Erysipelotrichaceae bacterium]